MRRAVVPVEQLDAVAELEHQRTVPPTRVTSSCLTAYGKSALEGIEAEVAAVAAGGSGKASRHSAIFAGAARGASLVPTGHIPHVEVVEAAILRAAHANGYIKKYGEKAALDVIAAGIKRGLDNPDGPTPHTPSRHRAEEPAQLRDEAARVRVWIPADVREILTREPEAVRFVVGEMIAEDDAVVLTAAPKDGKTFLAASIALELPLGRPVFGRYTVPGPRGVLWLDEEMGLAKLQRRLQRLARGLRLSPEEIEALAQGLRLFPQQGMTLTLDESVAAFHAEIEEFKPALVIVDSFAAVTSGIDDGNPERRAFYMKAIAPLRRMGTACLILAHPPLPSREQHTNAQKRPRGGGDILGTCDRALYMAKVSEEATEHGRTVTTTLGELFSREGGGLDGLHTLMIEDTGPDATVVRSTGGEMGALAAQVGQTNAIAREILHVLCNAPRREMYQPDLKDALTTKGYGKDSVQGAITHLVTQHIIEVLDPRPPKSGKWLRLRETPCD